jgi:hypothetical protein
MALDGALRHKKKSGGIVIYDSDTGVTYRDGVPIAGTEPESRETVDTKRRRLERNAMFGDDW